ncbi:hypothetical protein JVU11DRAFT_10642 [Chiua virens]|nr:hypothetical protein JVU11DRAFT_10640 [Chiua virens]KAG9309394.1 hypothetical protein JVU11DRAFT_10642 [Chiua virens]
MSPTWFQLGHAGGDTPPEVSATLKHSAEHAGGCDWLEQQAETNALLVAAMAIMHPELYITSLAMMDRLNHQAKIKGLAEIEEVVGEWESIFNAVSVIINWQSPYH